MTDIIELNESIAHIQIHDICVSRNFLDKMNRAQISFVFLDGLLSGKTGNIVIDEPDLNEINLTV